MRQAVKRKEDEEDYATISDLAKSNKTACDKLLDAIKAVKGLNDDEVSKKDS